MYIVNIWLLDGTFVLAGRFSEPDAVSDALFMRGVENDAVDEKLEELFEENSMFGVPDYAGGYKLSVKVCP